MNGALPIAIIPEHKEARNIFTNWCKNKVGATRFIGRRVRALIKNTKVSHDKLLLVSQYI